MLPILAEIHEKFCSKKWFGVGVLPDIQEESQFQQFQQSTLLPEDFKSSVSKTGETCLRFDGTINGDDKINKKS